MAWNDMVSVTLVTYNSGRFIKKCLESVLAQKYADLELIVIDNASTDGTIDILEQFEGRCRLVYNEDNIGFAAAQNAQKAAFCHENGHFQRKSKPKPIKPDGRPADLESRWKTLGHESEMERPH